MFERFIHVVNVSIFYYFLLLNNSPLYMDIVHCIIYSSVDGHLDHFNFLFIINNAARKIHVYACVWTYAFISLGHIARNEISGNTILCLTFEELPDYFPVWPHHLRITLAVYEGSNFSTSLPVLLLSVL